MTNSLELRMYGMVPYQLKGIQGGIQFGHSKDEFTLKVLNSILNKSTDISKENIDRYIDWLENWKTYIVLDGGSTNTNPDRLGTLNKHLQLLKENGVFVTEFYEPDLGDQLTGITFIVDERVFNKEKYPDPDPTEIVGFEDNILTGKILNWNDFIGGKPNLFLRDFLPKFKLASN